MLGQNGTSHEMKEFVEWRSAEVELEMKPGLSHGIIDCWWSHRIMQLRSGLRLNPMFVKSLHSMVPQVKLAGLQE